MTSPLPTALSTRPRPGRRTTGAVAALLLAVTLVACGGDPDPTDERADDPTPSATEQPTTATATPTPTPSEPPPPQEPDAAGGPPSEDQLETALLTAADVPAGFEASADEDTEDDTFEDTCLGDIGEFDDALGLDPESEAEAQFTRGGAASQAFVGAKLKAYADPAGVDAAFTGFSADLQGCTSVVTTDDDGVSFDLDVAYDDTVDVPAAQQQLRIEMAGTIAAGAESYDLTYEFVVSLSAGVLSIVGVSEVGGSDSGALGAIDDLAALQATRLADLVG